MITKVLSASLKGIEAYIVDVEADISLGLPATSIVGLPDKEVDESKERTRTAIKNSGFVFPAKKIVINLAPADIKKEGTSFDLPIAIGIIAASEQIESKDLSKFIIVGELSLDGSVRPVNGVLCHAIAAKENNIEAIIVPYENSNEASVVNGLKVYPVKNLKEAVNIIIDKDNHTPIQKSAELFAQESQDYPLDFSDVKYQEIFCTKILCNTM